ncbi:MAG: NADH:flavin oxidoreductase [Sulfolobales archaeon]
MFQILGGIIPFLSSELFVRSLRLRNRVVLPPMASELASPDGEVTNELLAYYALRSSCVGLVIVEHSYISPEGKYSYRQLGIWHDGLIEGLNKLSSTIKGGGAVAVIQLNHAGGRANPAVCGCRPIAPSSVPIPRGFDIPREMTSEDFERVLKSFKEAAVRAIRAGFDGVEIHGAHGYLLNQFLSPITNRRVDEFGGSLEGRMRFPLTVVEEVRKVLHGRLLMYRLGADDMLEGGFTVSEAVKVAVKLVEVGVDIIDVSGGLCGGTPPELQGIQGFFIPLAEKIKKFVDVPVVGVGGIEDPCFANRIIAEGRVDLVAVGRAHLKNPQWCCEALNNLHKCVDS